MKKSALIVVDYSNDFVADNGQLTCGKAGQQIEKYIVERIEAYNREKQEIFFMMDLHFEEDPYHPETKLFPQHNIEVTTGRQLYGKVKSFIDKYKNEDTVHY
ncbi:cysteine hydrolase family protein, partial [Staphylococcus succinus]|uniref:cysteine hydrolase family protein n=1 Tax=Staphylococcus succinus TaxID=61015 RepID=UPI000FEEDB23